MTIGERLLIIFLLMCVPLIFIGVPLFVFKGGIHRFALKPLQKCFDGIDLHESLQCGDVSFVYHTYRGFLVWHEQDEHRVSAPPEVARLLLSRLLLFNLTWGMLSEGFLFIPFFAIGNYIIQSRMIGKQEYENAMSSSRYRK